MKKLRFILPLLILLAVFAVPLLSNAADIRIPNPLNTDTVPGLIANVITWLLRIIGAVALIIFVYGGVLWLTAAGNDKRIKQGTDTLMWAGIGLAGVFMSYILVGFVLQILGVV